MSREPAIDKALVFECTIISKKSVQRSSYMHNLDILANHVMLKIGSKVNFIVGYFPVSSHMFLPMVTRAMHSWQLSVGRKLRVMKCSLAL